jgi:hypothetical protein
MTRLFAPKSIRSKKEVSFHSTFYERSGMKKCLDPDPGRENGRIGDKTSRIRNTDSVGITLKKDAYL